MTDRDKPAQEAADGRFVWHPVSDPPLHTLFDKSDKDRWEARVFVWVEQVEEPQKGRCVRRFYRDGSERISWFADGFMGDWTITHWMPMFEGPKP